MNISMNRRDFIKIAGVGTAALLAPAWAKDRPLGIEPEWDGISNPHEELKNIGDKFSFGIIADSQVGHADSTSTLYKNANFGLSKSIEELNKHEPNIEFLVHLGDLVNVPNKPSFDNWYKRVSKFDGTHVVNHGNHDTIPPYTRFRDYEEKLNGIRSVYYSFDVGKWHFITMPANIEFGNYDNLEVVEPMMKWLKKDLRANKDRPTIVFMHLHYMPQGLSQLEWYSHSQELKRRLLMAFTEHGNVKYYFNGHVHNGIKVTMKTAWTYKEINFMTLPSGTAPRPFGEEYSDFEEGLERGGYYTIVDVDGDNVTIRSRLSAVDGEFTYPDKFKKFTPEDDRRCFTKAIDIPPKVRLHEGGFETGINEWYKPYRYICDKKPGFLNEWRMKYKNEGHHSGYVYAKPMGENWVNDEYNEFYQILNAPKDGDPVFKGSYFIADPAESGGGYYRLIGIGGPKTKGEFKFLMEFDFSEAEDEYKSDYYPRAMGYHISGSVSSWMYLQNLGNKKQGMFIRLPKTPLKWHNLEINISDLYDKAMGKSGAYDKLGVNRFMLAAGVWSNKGVDKGSGAFFDSISLSGMNEFRPSMINENIIEVDKSIFETGFGQALHDKVEARKKNK